jgi:hypothetical protein
MFVKIMPQGSGGAIIGETVFTYVYIENIFQNLLKKNHCARKKLKLT